MGKNEMSEIVQGGRFLRHPGGRSTPLEKARRTRSGGLRQGEFLAPGGKIIPDHPWLTPGAMEFLETILSPTSRILETGAGGSTIWLSARAEFVQTYENNLAWFRCIENQITARGIKNVSLVYDEFYPEKGIQAEDNFFDLLLVDGRGRVLTIRTAMKSVRPGGWIFLDNSERERYHPIIKELDKRFSTKAIFKDGWEASAWKV